MTKLLQTPIVIHTSVIVTNKNSLYKIFHRSVKRIKHLPQNIHNTAIIESLPIILTGSTLYRYNVSLTSNDKNTLYTDINR